MRTLLFIFIFSLPVFSQGIGFTLDGGNGFGTSVLINYKPINALTLEGRAGKVWGDQYIGFELSFITSYAIVRISLKKCQ